MSDSQSRFVSKASAAHYQWGNACDGWHLVQTGTLSVIAERMPPGTQEAAHRHARAQQFFYVLRGELVVESTDARHVLRAHDGVHIPPLVVHQVQNVSDEPVDFLVISEPPGQGDREHWP